MTTSGDTTPKRDPLYGWVLVAVGTTIIALLNGTGYSFGVFFKPLLEEFGWTRTQLSGPASLRMLVTGVGGVFGGAIVDRVGPRWIVCGALAMAGIGYFLTSGADTLSEFYLYLGLITGIGMSSHYPALTSVIPRWFTRRRGLATGIILSGYGIGQIIFPPLSTQLISSFAWRRSFLLLGIIIVAVGIPISFLVRLPPKEEPGARPDAPEKKVSGPATEAAWSLKETIHTLPIWQLGLLYALFSLTLNSLMVHIVPFAIDIHIEPVAAALILTVIGACNALGRISGGWLSDVIGTKKTMALSILLQALAVPCLIVGRSVLWLYPIAVVFGLGYGGLSAVVPRLISEYYGVRSMGALLGIIQMAFAIGGMAGALFAGYVFDKTGSYTLAFGLLSIAVAITFVLCVTLRPPAKKRQLQDSKI